MQSGQEDNIPQEKTKQQTMNICTQHLHLHFLKQAHVA